MKHPLRELLGTTAVYSAGTLLTQFVSFLLLPLYTRYLTPADYGVLSLLVIIQSVLALFAELAVTSGVFRFYHGYDNESDRQRLLATGLVSILATGGVLFVLVQLFAEHIADFAFEFEGGAPLLRIVSATALCMPIVQMFQRTLQLHKRPVAYIGATLSQFVVTVSVTIYLVVGARYGVTGVLLGQLVGVAVLTVASFAMLAPALLEGPDREKWSALLSFSIPLVPTSIAAMIIAASDRFFLERMSDLHEVGMYSVADKMVQALQILVVVPFSMSWNQLAFSAQNDPELPRTFARTFRLFAVAMSSIVVLFTLVIRDLLRLATTPEFVPAWVVVPLLAIGPMTFGFMMILNAGIHLAKRTRAVPLITAVGTVANVALNFVLIPPLGMVGAAIATAVSLSINAVLTYRVSRRVFPAPYAAWPALSAIGAAAVVLTLYVALESDRLALSIPLRLGCLAAFAALLLGLRVTTVDEVRGLLRRGVQVIARVRR